MLKKIANIALALLVLLPMTACGGSESGDGGGGGTPANGSFSIDESALVQNFEKDAKTIRIPVNTQLSASQWKVSSDAAWCIAEKSRDGKGIDLMVKESEEPEVRTANVTIITPGKTYQMTVSQLGYGPAILLKANSVNIGFAGGEIDITVTTNVEYKVSEPTVTWLTPLSPSRGFVKYDHRYKVLANPLYQNRTTRLVFEDKRTNATKKAEPQTLEIVQSALDGNPADVVTEGDSLLKVSRVEALNGEYQPGDEPNYMIDGKIDNNIYHSRWGDQTVFPVTLDFSFNTPADIDYLVYHPRPGGGNGNFGKIDVVLFYSSAPNTPHKYGSYDFNESSSASVINFAATEKNVSKVRFVVHNGYGGFASSAEVQFFLRNKDKALEKQLLTVFTDITCSELRSDVTLEKINQLPSYFAMVASRLHDGSYDAAEKEFRIQTYKPYSDPAVWSQKLITRKYTMLDNPTGIYVNAGDVVVVLVGDTYGNNLAIHNVGEQQMGDGANSYVQTEPIGDSYILHPGVNKIEAKKTGMLFVVYNTDLASANAKPVKIHIPLKSGKVGGFWDLDTHKTNDKFNELVNRSEYKYFPVRGKNIIFYFHRVQLKEAVAQNIVSAINLWDEIVGYQFELMGVTPMRANQFNNHIFAISPEGSYMWASDHYIGFVYTYLNNLLLPEKINANADNAWGPSHEIGHSNQMAINWPSATESSNNLFANYTLYKLGKYGSRGAALKAVADARYATTGVQQSWVHLGGATYQGENPDLHMRMFWQLWVYFHRLNINPQFYPTLFNLLRETRMAAVTPGQGQLLFAKMASQAANLDLTEFFDHWGFFIPVPSFTLEQYGRYTYEVTGTQINEAKTFMQKFPKPKHPLQYVEDRKRGELGWGVDPGDVGHISQFQNNVKISGTVSYTQSGQEVIITNGQNAVAFEVIKNGKVVYFFNTLRVQVPAGISLTGAILKAVQADGTRVDMVKK